MNQRRLGTWSVSIGWRRGICEYGMESGAFFWQQMIPSLLLLSLAPFVRFDVQVVEIDERIKGCFCSPKEATCPCSRNAFSLCFRSVAETRPLVTRFDRLE